MSDKEKTEDVCNTSSLTSSEVKLLELVESNINAFLLPNPHLTSHRAFCNVSAFSSDTGRWNAAQDSQVDVIPFGSSKGNLSRLHSSPEHTQLLPQLLQHSCGGLLLGTSSKSLNKAFLTQLPERANCLISS